MPVFPPPPARVHAMMQEQALSRELKALEGLKLAPVVQATRVRDVQGSIYRRHVLPPCLRIVGVTSFFRSINLSHETRRWLRMRRWIHGFIAGALDSSYHTVTI